MMKYILVFIFGILTNISNAQEQDLPYNLNGAYINGIKGYKTIKVTTTYNKGDYKAQSIHYYDKFNRNYLTVDNYKDTLMGKYYFKFDKKGQVKRENNYSFWANETLDTSKIYWIIDWSYFPNGLIKKVDNTWFDAKSATVRTIITFKYDKNFKIIEEKTINCNLDSLSEKVYFEPNSSQLSQNQNPPFTSVSLTKYKYQPNKVIAEHYQDNQLKTKIVSETLNNKTSSFLIDTKGDTLRTSVTHKNSKGKIIKEQLSGDIEMSDYGEYGDGMSYDLTTYNYNSEDLIELITSENTETKTKLFTRFEYIKR